MYYTPIPYWCGAPEEVTMERLVMGIQGMSCGGCVGAVRRALTAVDGASVEKVTVGSAEIAYDSAKTSEEALLAAVESAGYRAQAVEGVS